MSDGVLDQAVRDHGDGEGDEQQEKVLPYRQRRLADPFSGDDQDRTMPEIQRVGALAEPAKGAEPRTDSVPARSTTTPPAMISPAPTTGTATSEPGYAL